METQEIFEKVIEIIKEYVKEPERLENVSMDTTIIQDLKVNSARLVDIIINSEDAFDIEIDDDDADEIKTVGDAVKVVERKLCVTQ
ncbi:MAG: acyl carrier protein [Desulfobacteraceae bacterium]|nr:acyl carrier protein [Desulfobacteraceae bacterium]MBC2757563.1 acyl carrier protein [Desulfobacteraceae bacterium]